MTTKLERKVKSICKEYAKDYDSGMSGFMSDLQQGGCQSGMIGELIYYSDTTKFYKKFQSEINELLSENLASSGLTITETFGDKWDNDDPLALDTYNQNLLAWFAFEETAFQLFDTEA
jgi:hypothetical protein